MKPPATMTPLKMVTGRAPKLSTQALQIGPGSERQKREREKKLKIKKGQGTKKSESERIFPVHYICNGS